MNYFKEQTLLQFQLALNKYTLKTYLYITGMVVKD